MNGRTLRTLAVKDLKEVSQNRAAWIPAVVIPMIFLVLLPLLIIFLPSLLGGSMEPLLSKQGPVGLMKANAPALAAELDGLNPQQTWIVLMTGYFLAPFFLIMPLMLSTIVGAESFVGEKERKTLEALVYTPASDAELFMGKVLASVLPAVALAWVSFIVYALVVNLAGYSIMGRLWFPTLTWLPLILWVTPAVATLGMGATVLISARVNTFMEAYQLSASLVVFVLALVVGQVTGVLYLSVEVGLLVGLVVWGVDAALIWFGIRTFQRGEIIARL